MPTRPPGPADVPDIAIAMSGLFQAAAASVALLIGLVVSWLALNEDPGKLLTGAAVAITSIWALVTGARRYLRRAGPGWCMESQRVAASVRLHRRLETLAVCGMAITWLAVGQIFLVFDLAG